MALSDLSSGHVTELLSTIDGDTLLAALPQLVAFVVLGTRIIGGIMRGAVRE
ncbi:hypothetical protein [Phytoactinopolyspora limicola]|uniref:hypothetical protein n=1 Tax=Phytoactinopolyspora limicola TaxID=2715536 RepID=UPI00140E513B|nr:hypothetical protein [Phytoactinopolyspora limicola]